MMMMKEGIFAGHLSLAFPRPPLHLGSLALASLALAPLALNLLALNLLAFAPLHSPVQAGPTMTPAPIVKHCRHHLVTSSLALPTPPT